MPELPEVETIKRDLVRKVVGRSIAGGWTDWPKGIKGIPPEQLFSEVKSLKIKDVHRRAKNLIFELDGMYLLFHLKMTGHFIVAPSKFLKGNSWQADDPFLKDRVNQFIHFALYLDNGGVLALSDMRKFAWVRLLTKKKLDEVLAEFGPEPLDKNFTFEKFTKAIDGKKGFVKKILLNQNVIAGIGNIYADEILFVAKILPHTEIQSLSDKKKKALYKAIRVVLKKAVDLRGTSTSDYRDTSGKRGKYTEARAVYRRTGEPCPVCGLPIERKKINGRSAHFCSSCQR